MLSRPAARMSVGAFLAIILMVLTGLSVPASAASTGSVKGVVTVAGVPLDFAKVQLYRNIDSDPGGDSDDGKLTRIKAVNTGKNGRFSFSGLKSKKDPKYGLEIYEYVVVVTDRSGKTVKQYARVGVKKGKTVTKNFRLQAASIVTGKVARSDGRSPAGLTVVVGDDSTVPDRGYNPEILPNTTTTVKADGTFRLSGLRPGFYEDLAIGGGRYAHQCYDFAASALKSCDSSPATFNFTLAKAERRALASSTVTELVSTLTGKVTDTAGKPLKGIRVSVVSTVDAGGESSGAETRSGGRFTISGVRAGDRVVKFYDPQRIWAPRYAGGVTKSSARVFRVVGGTNIANIDTSLKSIAKVKAVVTPGKSSAKIAFTITRRANGGHPSGTMTLTLGDISKKASVVKGKVKITLKGLPKGTQKIVATYSGTGSTQGVAKTYTVKVK